MKKVIFLILAAQCFAFIATAQKTPTDWHRQGVGVYYGANTDLAREKVSALKSSRIIIALIDTGVDTEHKDLQGAFWTNPGEIPNNRIDDDRNGFVDDIHGWNFLGSADGTVNIEKVGTEAFREYKRLRPQFKDVAPDALSGKELEEYQYYKRMESAAGIASYITYAEYLGQIAGAFIVADSVVAAHFPGGNPTVGDIQTIEVDPADAIAVQALDIAAAQSLAAGPDDLWKDVFEDNINKYVVAKQRIESLDDQTNDPRLKIGDNVDDFQDLRYGNGNISLHDSGDGTVHTGLIAARGVNDYGIRGIYPEAEIMVLRAYPEGEEYDKDVYSAIRYAVDNGAKIINIGFSKKISPHADKVREAIAYAESKNVLIVRAAGDAGIDLDLAPVFPSVSDNNGRRFSNMIVVGASTPNGMVADFSSYGAKNVDLFAPGHDIASTAPGDEYARFIGTSLSSAIVSGAAALVWSHFPKLGAAQVKELLIRSSYNMSGHMTPVPKKKDQADFSTLSVSGGILDAAAAVDAAQKATSR